MEKSPKPGIDQCINVEEHFGVGERRKGLEVLELPEIFVRDLYGTRAQ